MSEKLLSKADILSADDLVTERVAVPEWGGEVIVAVMSAADRDLLELSVPDSGTKKERFANLRARTVALTAVDEQGQRLFTMEDVEALGKKSCRALRRLYNVASRLNGLGAEEVEELIKKSDPSPPAGSSSS